MSGFVTDGNEINCHECKYGKNCNVGRGHGHRVGSCFQFELEKKQTNADRIRAMQDEELAKSIARIAMCVDCKIKNPTCTLPISNCEKSWLEWLKQEAET